MLLDCVVGADVVRLLSLRYFEVYMERRKEISKWRGNHIKSKAWLSSLFIIDLPAMQEYDYRLTGSYLSGWIGDKGT